MNKGPKERFSKVADDYAAYRPSYPSAALDWIISRCALPRAARLLDMGCGTGISARLFAARGLKVTGIDPNEEMLAQARRAGGGVEYARGESARTGLPDASFDAACAAQAFHWFELEPTRRELARILVPGGRCAALWNVRASTPLLDAYEALLLRRSSEYAGLERPRGTIETLKALPGISRVEEASFRHVQSLDLPSLLGRARSSSYVAHGVADLRAFEDELTALFERHAKGGRVEWIYDTIVLVFKP